MRDTPTDAARDPVSASSFPYAGPLRVLVVDDEPPARRKLQRWLERDDGIVVVGLCADGYEALDTLHSAPVDALFLDIQMPELSGFDVLAQLAPGVSPLVVFATAFDRYGIDAFPHHPLDYLLKPYDYGRFAAAIAHVKALNRRRRALEAQQSQQTYEARLPVQALLDAVRPEPAPIEHIAVRRAGRIELLPVQRVDWIGAEGNYVMIHAAGEQHLIRENISRLAQKLDGRRFVRIHRSTLVRLGAVQALYPASHGDFSVEMCDGSLLSMSRTYRDRLRDVLQVGF